MEYIDTVIIGGGQAGLAMSHHLSGRGVEHVVLEKGRVGERWRSERWDSLHLLTPRWLSRLSGWTRDQEDPNGFMDRGEVVRYLDAYAAALSAPVLTGVSVKSVDLREHGRGSHGYLVRTDGGDWTADHVVVATGQSQHALVPSMAVGLSSEIQQVVPTAYRHPDQMETGGVLVVGASATGIQLAAEIHASGRPVTLAVGKHTRLPRTYRGHDILWWLDRMGILDQKASEVPNLTASMDQPSMQLTGSADHSTLDLGILQERGVRLVGRAHASEGTRVAFEDDLVENVAAADFKLAGLRRRIDRFVEGSSFAGRVPDAEPFVPTPVEDGTNRLDLPASGIRSVLWATGFGRSYPWLRVPVVDARGELVHEGGVTTSPGLYVLGLNFLRRRSSSFIAGVGTDAEELAVHLAAGRTNGNRASRSLASRRAVA